MPDWLLSLMPWAVVLICVAAEAFFAAAEIAIISANEIELEAAARAGRASAKKVLWFRQNPDQLFGTTLLGTNLSTVTGSTVASLTLLSLDPHRGEFYAMLLMSPLILLGGELVPKSIAQSRALAAAELLAGPLATVNRVLFAPILLIRGYTAFLYRAMGISGEARRSAMASREELILLMEVDEADGEMNDDEREMISRIFEFSHLTARDTMISLVDMVALEMDAKVTDAVTLIEGCGFSRLPVFDTRIDNIVGILHHLDLLSAAEADQPVVELMRPPFFVPEAQEIDEILVFLQRQASTAAIVVDEFGGAVGLITLEDILEEIVGDIDDEYDREGRHWRALNDTCWLVSARAPVEKLNETFDLKIPEDADFESVAGFILDRLRHIPCAGETVDLGGRWQLTVRSANQRSIQEVILERLAG